MVAFILYSAVFHFTKGLGFGDVKYAALLGYILGPEKLVIAFLITAFLGIIIYLAGIYIFRMEKTTRIPYAPFLSAGAILAVGGVT